MHVFRENSASFSKIALRYIPEAAGTTCPMLT